MAILLTETDVRALLTMDDLIETMELALADFAARNVTQPVRTVLQVGENNAFYGVMPAWMPSRPALGTKLVTVFENNAELRSMGGLAGSISRIHADDGEVEIIEQEGSTK